MEAGHLRCSPDHSIGWILVMKPFQIFSLHCTCHFPLKTLLSKSLAQVLVKGVVSEESGPIHAIEGLCFWLKERGHWIWKRVKGSILKTEEWIAWENMCQELVYWSATNYKWWLDLSIYEEGKKSHLFYSSLHSLQEWAFPKQIPLLKTHGLIYVFPPRNPGRINYKYST